MIGYDFVGPRVELEGIYRRNEATVGSGNFNAFGAAKDDTRHHGQPAVRLHAGGRSFRTSAPAPVSPSSVSALNTSLDSTQFAYQGIVGLAGTSTRCSASTSMAATTARRTRISAAPVHQQQLQRDAGPAAEVRRTRRRPRRRRRRLVRRRRSWCSSTGTARTCRSRP